MTEPGKGRPSRFSKWASTARRYQEKLRSHQERLEKRPWVAFPLESVRRFNKIEGKHLAIVIALNLFIAVIPLTSRRSRNGAAISQGRHGVRRPPGGAAGPRRGPRQVQLRPLRRRDYCRAGSPDLGVTLVPSSGASALRRAFARLTNGAIPAAIPRATPRVCM